MVGAAVVAGAARGEAIADVALALKVHDDFGIGNLAECDHVIRSLSVDPSRTREVEVLRRAREVASRGDFFLGVLKWAHTAAELAILALVRRDRRVPRGRGKCSRSGAESRSLAAVVLGV